MPIVRTQKYKIAGGIIALGLVGYLGYTLYSRSVGVLISNAQTCFEANDFNCARENLQAVLEKNPNHLDALFLLCRIDFMSGNHQGLEPTLRQVLGIQPDLLDARKMLARVLLSKCRFDEARNELNNLRNAGAYSTEEQGAMSLALAGLMIAATDGLSHHQEVAGAIEATLTQNPGQADAHLAKSLVHIQLGEGPAAFQEVQTAIQTLGENFVTQWALARALYLNEDLDNAMIAFEKADAIRKSDRELRPPGPWVRELYLNEGLVLIEQGKIEEAQRRLDIASENDPHAVRPALALVNLYLIQGGVTQGPEGLVDDSQRFYRRAIDELLQKPEILASDPVYRYQLSLVHAYLRNYRESVAILEELTQETPPYLQAFQELGNLRHAQANYRGAAEAFGRILEINPNDPFAGYNYGTLLLRIQEVEQAREHLRAVVSIQPDWLQARLNLALAHRLAGLHTEAQGAYQQVLERSPNNMNALIGLGLIAATRGDLEAARIQFNTARDQHPTRSEPYFYLGQIELDAGRTVEAQAMFEKCLSLDPENEYAILALVDIRFRRGTWEQAREPLNLILNKPNPRLRVVAENAMALVEVMTGREDQAEELLNRLKESASELEPYLQGGILTNQAILASKRGDHDKALEIAQQVVELLPSEADAHYNLGTLQLEAGRFSEAAFTFRRAIEESPNHLDAQFNLAVAQSASNRWDEALALLSTLGRQENAPLEVVQSLAEAYLGAGDAQAALDILQPAIENRGGAVQLQTLRAKAYVGIGNIAEAARLSQELAGAYPQDGEVQAVRGMTAFLSGDVRAGETALRRALQIRPEDPTVKVNLASLLIAKGNFDNFSEAEKLLDEVEQNRLFLDEVDNQRAFLAVRRSDYETARSLLQRSLQKNSDQPKIQALLNQWEGL